MDIRKLQRAIVDGLEDVKGQNIVVFNTEHLSSLFERVIIASGTSNRQTKSLASSVREAVKKAGFPVPRLEGEDNGEWIIVDCGAAVAHVMQPAIRDYYHLEEIWGDKPVKIKIDGAAGTPRLVKASEDDSAPKQAGAKAGTKKASAKAPAKKTAAPAKAAAKTPGKATPKTAPRGAAGSAPRTAAKTPARKAAAPAKGVTRVVGVKRAPTAAKTAASAKAKTAAKTPAKKAPARKSSSRA